MFIGTRVAMVNRARATGRVKRMGERAGSLLRSLAIAAAVAMLCASGSVFNFQGDPVAAAAGAVGHIKGAK
jgi:hypothetical protein